MSHPTSPKFGAARLPLLLATLCVLLITLFISPVYGYPTGDDGNNRNSGNGKTVYVEPHECIQDAIRSAAPGTRIIVKAGTYKEQLTIDKDGISLIGKHATLVPPKSFTPNTCSGLAGDGTEAGICVTGKGVKLDEFKVEHREFLRSDSSVKDVTITGFTVRGFYGLNIAVVGAQTTRVRDNTLQDGKIYGLLTVGSKDTRIKGNKVTTSAPPVPVNANVVHIAICMDDQNPVTIAYNKIKGYNLGLCVQTSGADIHDNVVQDMCIGMFIDPFIVGVKIYDNEVRDTNKACAGLGQPAWGIIISGAHDTLVRENRVTGIKGSDKPDDAGLALILWDDFFSGSKELAIGNRIVKNKLKDNDVDVAVATSGTGNVFKDNKCTTAVGTPTNDVTGICTRT